jgi:RimJ/RimL family protein N-acetyltransferase
VNHPDVRETIGSRTPKNQQQEREWLDGLADRDGVVLFVASDGEPVGSAGYADVNPDGGTAEVGYAVHPDHWGHGYATEAVTLLTRYAFEERRLSKLHAGVYAHNSVSMRVLEKAGWNEEAVLEREAFVGGERVDLHRFTAHAETWASGEIEGGDREERGRTD